MRSAQPGAGRRRPPGPPAAEGADRLLSGSRWPRGFDPERLGREASLNKVVAGPVAGVRPDHIGINGGDLLGRDAIAGLVRRHGGATVPSDAVSDWLAGGAPGAAAVIDEMGDRLASLIATLRSPATAAAATGARRTYFEVWQRLQVVTIGGGLTKGSVGERVAARAGVDVAVVAAARHPEWLPLIGAARSTGAQDGLVMVMDGGQTSIKRGIAELRAGALAGLLVLAPVPVASIIGTRMPAVVAREVRTMRAQHTGTAGEVIFSVASYLDDGRPIQTVRSIYERLDPATMRTAFGTDIRLVHDGTAAWRAEGTEVASAVIMLGTWLGVGIGPHRAPLRPLAAGFTLRAEG